jgi:predicted nucleic acid-binding Zn ribbon protein
MAKQSRLEMIRRAVLREWRGHDELVHPDERLHVPKEFIAEILRKAGAAEGIDSERLREMWKEIAGDFISRYATPVSLKAGCLTLHVLQPTMRFDLEQNRSELLKKIQQAAGPSVVKTLRFVVG